MSRSSSSRSGKMDVGYLLNPSQSKQGSSSKNRVYQCKECSLTYSLQGNLNKHVRSLQQMALVFLWNTNTIESQIKSKHEQKRPHKCSYCEAAFPFSDGLRRHIQLVHSVRSIFQFPSYNFSNLSRELGNKTISMSRMPSFLQTT